MATVGIPLTGSGDSTASVATDLIGGEHYQRMKLFDGVEGSTLPFTLKATTPGAADPGLITRPIGSTAFNQAIVGAVGITSGSSAVELTSAGSTRLVGRVTLDSPSTIFTVNGAVDLTSAGSTKVAARFTIDNPTTAVTVSSGVVLGAGSSANMLGQVFASGTTKVDVSSGVILGAGSSANMLGQVQATGTTKVDVSSGVILAAGSSANTLGSVALVAGTTLNTVGSVALVAGSSANILGQAVQGPGSSANAWFQQSIPYSSGGLARTTANTSVDVSVIAANANRKALVIASLSTAQVVALGLSTGAVTTALGNANLFLSPSGQVTFGMPGGMPFFTGPVRGINISSTAIGGGVSVMEFT
jgi:hypothetical protein